jgi:3-methyl-2-oxobutanoate hydroxymethyltransferase
MKRLESAGAYAAELELVPHQLATYLCKKTSMLLMSLGSGSGCDTQFLFSDDILGDYDERIPRHAKAYRNFLKENQRLQQERISAFKEYSADVQSGRFPASNNLVSIDQPVLDEVLKSLENRK